jgi:DNA replication protein DnaC
MKGFYGHPDFRDGIMDYINNLEVNYYNGQSLCLTGHRGTGKTMAACCILKEALKKGYSVFYTTMVDAVANLLSSQSNDYRYDLKHIDFLIIDELDQRFFHTVNSNDLYGNHFENIFRIRVQNKLPTIICTNSEDVEQIFNGEFKESFISLSSQFLRILRASGKDVRKNKC